MSNKPRILQVIDHLGPGGAQSVLRDLVSELRDRYDFHVAVLGQTGCYASAFERLGVPLFYLGRSQKRWDPSSLWALHRLIRSGGYEIVHAHLFKSMILGGVSARLAGCCLVLHDHTGIYSPDLEAYMPNPYVSQMFLRAYRLVLSQANCVCALNVQMCEKYIREYGVAPSKVQLVPNSVDPDRFMKTNRSTAGAVRQQLGLLTVPVVMMAGRLEPEKGWDTFLDVATRFQQLDRPVAFLGAGAGSEEARLKKQIRDRKLTNVLFLGYRTDIPDLLSEADVFLLTSRQEASPVVLLEAMAARCPIVATQTLGATNLLTNGVDGLLAPVGDSKILAQQIVRVLDSPDMARTLGERACQKVIENYRLTAAAKQLGEVYRKVIQHEVL